MSPLGIVLLVIAIVGVVILGLWKPPDPDYLAGREKGRTLQAKGRPLDACGRLKGRSPEYIQGCKSGWAGGEEAMRYRSTPEAALTACDGVQGAFGCYDYDWCVNQWSGGLELAAVDVREGLNGGLSSGIINSARDNFGSVSETIVAAAQRVTEAAEAQGYEAGVTQAHLEAQELCRNPTILERTQQIQVEDYDP